MGYLICDKCHGKYVLKPDESPDDFLGCSCGGNLHYVEGTHMSRRPEPDSSLRLFGYNISLDKKILGLILIILLIIVGAVSISFFENHSSAQVAVNNSEKSSNYFSDIQTSPQSASKIVFGATNIQVPNGATVVTQVDRIIKDPASKTRMNVAPDHQPQSTSDLVPWMEGNRIKELMNYAHVKVVPGTNVTVKKINNTWYGPDDNGNYVYAIDPGKVTPLRANTVDNNTKVITVTHGFSVLVPAAVKNHANLVVACGDLPGKAQAEAYLNNKGINCYAPCDRWTFSLLNKNSTGISLGTMPIRQLKNGSGAVIGAQPISVSLGETFIVQTTIKGYPDQYCDTPKRYFDGLQKTYGIKLNTVIVDANVGQAQAVVDAAHKNNANVIAVRVLNNKDKGPVESWLKENPNHRALLFHSAPYEPGYSLFFEFPNQVTGDDTKPVFISNDSDSDLQNRFAQVRSLWQ